MNEYQQTPEWFQARLGKLTASNMTAAMGIKKDGTDYAERANLKMNILAERLTRQAASHYVNDAMRHGNEQEPVIKDILRQLGYPVEDTGFIEHADIRDFGASPDGLIGEDGLIEVKCPATSTHLKWILAGVVPEEHKPQIIVQIACTGRRWCDFVSFDPRIQNPAMRIFKRRYEPTAAEVEHVLKHAVKFLEEVSQMQEFLTDAYL